MRVTKSMRRVDLRVRRQKKTQRYMVRNPVVDPKRKARRYRDRRIATAISQIMLYLVYAPDWGRMGDKKMRETLRKILRKILLDMEAAR